MRADLDLLCVSVYCTADDLLPRGRVTPGGSSPTRRSSPLCVAQVLMGIP